MPAPFCINPSKSVTTFVLFIGGIGTMKEFIQRYEDRIHGVLSCFDRMLSRISADHERLADGAVLQQPEHPFPKAQDISCRAGATSQAARNRFGQKRRTAIQIRSRENQEGRRR